MNSKALDLAKRLEEATQESHDYQRRYQEQIDDKHRILREYQTRLESAEAALRDLREHMDAERRCDFDHVNVLQRKDALLRECAKREGGGDLFERIQKEVDHG